MKKLIFAAIWLGIAAVLFGLSYGWVRLDLWMNPWLREVGFEWIRMITSHHGITLLYLHDSTQAFLFLGVMDFLLSGAFTISTISHANDWLE